MSLLSPFHWLKGVVSSSPMSMGQKVHVLHRERPQRHRLGEKAVEMVICYPTPSRLGLRSRLPRDLGSRTLVGCTSGVSPSAIRNDGAALQLCSFCTIMCLRDGIHGLLPLPVPILAFLSGGPPWTWLQAFVSLFVSFISASLLERPVNTRPGSSMELL